MIYLIHRFSLLVFVALLFATSGSAYAAENLVLNPDFETASGSLPANWAQGSWGTNTATFTYGLPAFDGTHGGTVQVSGYSNGDAKWYFNDVQVTAGTAYTFTDHYQSNIESTVTIRYTSGTAVSYVDLAVLPASAGWTTYSATITPPAGATSLTVFHLIRANGTLSVDGYSLASGASTPPPPPPPDPTPTPPPPPPPTPTPPPVATSTNSILNPDFETASGSLPANWAQGSWGTNTATFTYGLPAFDGTHGGTVQVSGYSNGDAKWYFNDVQVTAGTAYTFTDHYQSNIESTVTIRYTSGTAVSYVDLAVLPASAGWTTYSATITPPAGATSLTVFHLIRANGTLSVDGYSLASGASTPPPPPPPTAPTCTLSLSSSTITQGLSASLSWTSTNATTLSINQGIGPVALTGSASVSPNATTTYTGSVTGTGGTATCSTTLGVKPAPPTTTSNLINNPSLESDTDNNSIPDFWAQGSWGTNTATFTYGLPAFDGTHGGTVQVSGYSNGDAKWYFNDVAVTGGATYTFTDRYQSAVTTQLTARYTSTSGTQSYAFLATVPASSSWASASATFVPPSGTASVTIFHVLQSAGTLSVDAYTLAPGLGTSQGDSFDKGYITLTFDDGWRSQLTESASLLTTFNLKASFFIITTEMINASAQASITNPSFETASSATTPQSWSKIKSGTNNAVYTYPATGFNGGKAATVAITSFTNGAASWAFNPVVLTDPGDPFEFSDKYLSSVPTQLRAVFSVNGQLTNVVLGSVPAAQTWQTTHVTFTPPNGTQTVTIYHELISAGSLTVDEYHLFDVEAYMTVADVTSLQSAGHEVSAHTRTHPDLTTLSSSAANTEIVGSRQDLTSRGFTPVTSFVYPYGTYNPAIINQLKAAGFLGARTTNGGFNSKTTPLFELKDFEVTPNTTFAQMKAAVDNANATHTWVIFMFHEVDHTGLDYSIAPETLEQFLEYLKNSASAVITMRDGLALPRGVAPAASTGSDVTPSGDVQVPVNEPAPMNGDFGPVLTTPTP